MSAGHDELRVPMQYDIMREALNRYQGRCIALADRARTRDREEAWLHRADEAEDRTDAFNPRSRSEVAAMTTQLREMYAALPEPSSALAAS